MPHQRLLLGVVLGVFPIAGLRWWVYMNNMVT